jgi:hypothetical protein
LIRFQRDTNTNTDINTNTNTDTNNIRMRNITSESWLRVSSFRSGHEPSNLVDGNKDTFWQSDGQLPHWLQFDFDTRQDLRVTINESHIIIAINATI